MNKYVHIPLYDKCEWPVPLAFSNYLYYSLLQKDCQYLLPELQVYGVNWLFPFPDFSIFTKNEPFPPPKDSYTTDASKKTERKQVMEEKNRALAERMISGDEAAFDELYRSYSGKLYRMAYFITGNRSDSEDILQETFVKCYLHRNELRQPERLESWLYQILVRTAWKSEKRKKGKKEFSFDGILDNEDDTGMAERIQKDSGEEPLDHILKAEASSELWKAVNRLSVKHRTVVFLYYYNDLTTKEIARLTGTMEGTVKSRLHKARNLLREQLTAKAANAKEDEAENERRLCHE